MGAGISAKVYCTFSLITLFLLPCVLFLWLGSSSCSNDYDQMTSSYSSSHCRGLSTRYSSCKFCCLYHLDFVCCLCRLVQQLYQFIRFVCSFLLDMYTISPTLVHKKLYIQIINGVMLVLLVSVQEYWLHLQSVETTVL